MADSSPWHLISVELDKMVDHFTNLVKASRIPEEGGGEFSAQQRKVPGDLLEVWAEQLLFSAYMCLHHITELKKSAALSNFETQIGNARAVKTQLTKEDDNISSNIGLIRSEAQTLLAKLEDSYYSSQYKGKPTESGVSDQLRELCHLALEAPLAAAAVQHSMQKHQHQ